MKIKSAPSGMAGIPSSQLVAGRSFMAFPAGIVSSLPGMASAGHRQCPNGAWGCRGALENCQAGLAVADKSLQRVSTSLYRCWIVPMYCSKWAVFPYSSRQSQDASSPPGRTQGRSSTLLLEGSCDLAGLDPAQRSNILCRAGVEMLFKSLQRPLPGIGLPAWILLLHKRFVVTGLVG
jgi:hypothetical protein